MVRALAALALLVVLGGSACHRDRPAASAPAARVRVELEGLSGRASSVVAEVASTDADRERGLMFRERLGDDEGMLFDFEEESPHPFWMKNTLIPLDMIFVDGRGTVVGVVERAVPGSLEPRTAAPSRWVLEVRGGWARERGIAAGDRLTIREIATAR